MEKQSIKEVLLEQRQEIDRIFKQKIVGREAAWANKDILGSNLIKVITGVRRCGKSVFAHQLFKDKDYAYVNFDDERLIGLQANSLNDFLECAKELQPDFKSIFLDEIQNVTGWELFVNRLKRQDYNLVVTGSNSKLLSRDLATHLTGRHFSVELYPFSFKEFLDYRGFHVKADDFYITEKRAALKKFLEEYLNYGGFPEIFKLESKAAYLRELYDKIIMRDIILRYSIKYSQDLKEMALYAFSNFASRFSFNKIKNIFEIKSVHTVKNYINYLEEAYLLFQLTAFSRKLKEQIKLPKKIYCIDTGMINSIVSRGNFDYGRLIENLVFLELKRRRKEIYFYAAPDFEVDFVVKEGLEIRQLIQVCYSLANNDTKKREINALIKASRELDCHDLLVITWDNEAREKIIVAGKKHSIAFIPLWKWLLC